MKATFFSNKDDKLIALKTIFPPPWKGKSVYMYNDESAFKPHSDTHGDICPCQRRLMYLIYKNNKNAKMH